MQVTFKIHYQPFEAVVRYGFTLVAGGVQLRGYMTMHIKPGDLSTAELKTSASIHPQRYRRPAGRMTELSRHTKGGV